MVRLTTMGVLFRRRNAVGCDQCRQGLKRILKAVGFPLHFSPHCLRHTFASLLLQQQESPAYVQRQLGHSSIKLTVDTYGKWLPMGNKAAVDRLDDQSGSKMVAIGSPPELKSESDQVVGGDGSPV